MSFFLKELCPTPCPTSDDSSQVFAGVTVTLLLSAVFILLATVLLNVLLPRELAAQGGPPSAQPVSVTRVERTDFTASFEAIGSLRAFESVDISPNISEIIEAIHFGDNAIVSQGDLIVELRNREVRAELAEATARVAEAKRQYERVRSLGRDGAEPPAIIDERLRNYETAVAQKEATEARLADRLIVAPFSGQLGIRNVSVGALVRPGDVINTLDDISRMKLDFDVPSSLLSVLRPDLRIEATTPAYRGETFMAVVASLNTRVDPITRSVTVRAELDNEDGRLRPGLLMKALVFGESRETLLIPEESLITRGGSRFVYRVEENGQEKRAALAPVETGERGKGVVEIINGLSEGEVIVTHGTVRLRGGELLKIVDPPASNATEL